MGGYEPINALSINQIETTGHLYPVEISLLAIAANCPL